jgi:glutathione S-transferase
MLEVTGPGPDAKPILLAESGLITQYLCEHFPEGRERLTPKRWKDGQEGQVGGETESWLRWAYYLHYNEGSFMPLLVLVVILSREYFPGIKMAGPAD